MENREGDSSNLVFLTKQGGLAHLARVLAWQARGDRFESDILHKLITKHLRLNLEVLFFSLLHTGCTQLLKKHRKAALTKLMRLFKFGLLF